MTFFPHFDVEVTSAGVEQFTGPTYDSAGENLLMKACINTAPLHTSVLRRASETHKDGDLISGYLVKLSLRSQSKCPPEK